MITLKAFIVDDEQQSRHVLGALLREFCPEVKVLGVAGSFEEALAVIPELSLDLLFLDVNLGDQHTGFDLLDRIGTRSLDIVFVTAYEAYALKAHEYAALHYLLKPVSHQGLRDTVGRVAGKRAAAAQLLKNQPLPAQASRIALSDMNKTEFVSLDEISYLESNGSYTTFFLKDNRHFVRSRNLKYFEEALVAQPRFIRVHKSYVVNKDQVRAFRKGSQELELFSGATVPVSIGYRALLEHLGNGLIL